ncbi:MAG: hypothetical protein PHR77_04765 [Kiritimatiellae bacterium]|nr:hypothetical protein [Kiritimatiellia bacterium]MDD5519460.1 hypothetical protein [Kiritimatiellia bacterium]
MGNAICKNCARWNPLSQSLDAGVCKNIQMLAKSRKHMPLDMIWVSNDRVITTGPNFGCIHFTPKKPTAHPGTVSEPRMNIAELKTICDKIGQAGLARQLNMSRQGVNSWLQGKRNISAVAATAIRARGLDNPAVMSKEAKRTKNPLGITL